MIRLKTLRIRNFLSFESEDIDVQKAGLYLISGWNKKEGDSNGSGKSSILNAICFALFGRTSTGLTKADVKRWSTQKPLLVELTLMEGSETYVITRTSDETTFTISGKPVEGYKKDVQSAINDTFKTSYDIFINSTMFSLNRSDPLAASTDAEKKKLFKPIFQLERLDKAYDKAKTKYDVACTHLDELEWSIKNHEESLKDVRNQLFIYIGKYNNYADEKIKSIKSLKDRIEALAPQDVEESRALQNVLSKLSVAYGEYQSLLPLVDSWRLDLSSMNESKAITKAKWNENSKLLDEMNVLEGTTSCRLCGEPLDKDHLENHRQEIAHEQADLTQKYSSLGKEMLELDDKIRAFQETEEEVKAYEKERDGILQSQALLQATEKSKEAQVKELQSQIRKISLSDNPYNEMLTTLRIKSEKIEMELEQYRMEDVKVRKDSDVYAFLKWVFSKEGVSSFIIERAFGRLESLANRYLSLISSEGFQLEIKPQRELKSKAIREEIDIVVKTNNIRAPYWALSDGQRQRLNIAMLLAVYKLCKDLGVNRFDFLLLDEVLDLSLAEKGQDSVMKLMRRLLASEAHNIFIISHRPGISSEFDRIIEVIRGEDGISHVE